MQDPVPVLKYMHANRLNGQGLFKALNSFLGQKLSLCLLQVPLGVKKTYFDQVNSVTLWRNANKKEIRYLGKYKSLLHVEEVYSSSWQLQVDIVSHSVL